MVSRVSKRVYFYLAALVLIPIVLLIASPKESESCGPYFTQTIFSYSAHPDLPLGKYAQGDLGIIKPNFARSYLAVAYRYLIDRPLTPREQQDAIKLWNKRLFNRESSTYVEIDSSVPNWDSLAHSILPMGSELPEAHGLDSIPQPAVDVDAPEFSTTSAWSPLPNGDYQYYYSIGVDALQNASRRLQELVKQYGKNSNEAKDWVRTQRLVFATGETILPEELADVSTVIGANRQYQSAAAYFYRERYDEAQVRFEKIALNEASPWKHLGLYLAARSLTRKATIGGDLSALQKALAMLEKIKDPKLERAVLFQKDYILGLIDPLSQTLEQAKRLQDNDGRYFEHELDDYTKLLDRSIHEVDWYFSEVRHFDSMPTQLRNDDMTDWIYTFQSSDSVSTQHAIAQYKAKRTKPWLIAVLSKLAGSPLDDASMTIKTNDPAYASVAYYRARSLGISGQKDLAKQVLDEALASNLGGSARNDFMILRQQYATDMRDLITMLARVPVGETESFDYMEWPSFDSTMTEPKYDTAALRVLNRTLSLDRLMEAVRLNALPNTPQRDLMRAVWSRAVILGREDHAKELAARLATIDTALSSYMRKYLLVSTPAERHREAIFILLKHPGLSPLVWEAPGRREHVAETDSYRENGWCPIYADTSGISSSELHYRGLVLEPAALAFLSAQDRSQADEEWRTLSVSSPAVNYLANEAVKWAKAVPKDPRIPEALHLAVRASRYGCNDERTGNYSSAAYKLLHAKYGKTAWAKKTPYWFGEN